MEPTVQQVMTKDPFVMSSDTAVSQAAAAMSERRIGSVVVMEKGKPCGIVTSGDIKARVLDADKDPSRTPLAEVCSRRMLSVRPDQLVDDAITVMKSHRVKRLLVMAGDRLAGIVSLGDLTARD